MYSTPSDPETITSHLLQEGITQSVECDTFNIEVVGSSPTALTSVTFFFKIFSYPLFDSGQLTQ